MNAKIKNLTEQPVMVFHAWLLPSECRVMSLEAAKEAAKIAGIVIPGADGYTDWLKLQEEGLKEIWAEDPLAQPVENSADNRDYPQENKPAPEPAPSPTETPAASKKPAGKSPAGKRAPKK